MKLTPPVRGRPLRRPTVVSNITHRDRNTSAISPWYTNTGTLSMACKSGLARRLRNVGSEDAMSGRAPYARWTARDLGCNLGTVAADQRFRAGDTGPGRPR